MNSRLLVASLLLATALAGCADEPVVIPPPAGMTAHDALAMLDEAPVAGGVLLGLFAHGHDSNRIPWLIGPVSTYEHMHLSGGGNRGFDRGTGDAWYGLFYVPGAEPKVTLTKIASEVSIERTFDAEHFGWDLGSNIAGKECAPTHDAAPAIQSADAWQAATELPAWANFQAVHGGQPLILYIPELGTDGPGCGTETPTGFQFLPQTDVYAVIATDIGAFLQGGVLRDAFVVLVDAQTGAVVDASAVSDRWGPDVRHAQRHAVHSDLPGLPVAAQTFEAQFSVPEGQTSLLVNARLVSGPALYDGSSVQLVGPSFDGTTSGVDATWQISDPGAGGWTLTYSFTQAQPNADYVFDVTAITHAAAMEPAESMTIEA